jgi:hypothetical protein
MIYLPFTEKMKKQILAGKKTQTVRLRVWFRVGSVFRVGGQLYQITKIRRLPLDEVAIKLYEEDGFLCPKDFREYFTRVVLHPKGLEWDDTMLVYVCWFKKYEDRAKYGRICEE